ncbi:pilus assembly protein N-terminal domain-containing protein [Vibrio sp. SCSIO 43135]|uniref:type II and III secretion system protein family protein n=1 Tax=Vibrio sp. SCSIO 43135 TaxID=2819096 RepID=UPI00207608AF|nr:pilus assembly protein N-terminal domain-containing protein [Vibrio sp. SCSIO 43135]USD40141.1 pilus assembly protein N-terminal domain-containing protein [Vibrio sp. SCSIO 43135]
MKTTINLGRWLSFGLVLLISNSALAQKLVKMDEGQAKTISVQQDVSSVFISQPEIADYQVIDSRNIVVYAKETGRAALLVFNENGEIIVTKNIQVNKSLEPIRQQLEIHYPNVEVNVSNIGDQVVLTGTVPNEQLKDDLGVMVGELLAKKSDEKLVEWSGDLDDQNDNEVSFMTRRSFEGLVNNIEVVTTKQVNVKLTIAEVSQSFMEEIGVQYGSSGANPGIFVNPIKDFSSSDILSVITAIGDDTVGHVLAEPNLSVISGENASFLVGGEIPVVTVVDGGTNIEYKEFGIRLDLMAKVLNDEKIKLALMPEVSSLDTQYEDRRYSLPALKSRRAQTTVELGDGQSFVLAGLLSSEDQESLSKIPYIGDIPVLGALFRKSSTKRNKMELIIVATVNLVQPVEASQLQLPMMQKTSTLSRYFGLESGYQTSSEKWVGNILSTGGFKYD